MEAGKWQMEIGSLTITTSDVAIGSVSIAAIIGIITTIIIIYCCKKRKEIAELANKATIAVRNSLPKNTLY